MTLIRPFAGLRPLTKYAGDVLAPPYDVLNTEEARQRAHHRPYSFLHISKPEIDLPTEIDPYSTLVYTTGAQNLQRLLETSILQQDPQPYYYLYQLTMGPHQQTGLVAVASVADYDQQRIRKHELTRPDKEDDRVRQIDALNAQTGPVFLTYRQDSVLETQFQELTQSPPEFTITADDGVIHTLWVIKDPSVIQNLTQHFDQLDCLYIADGHHRSAAASRVAAQRQANNPQHTGEEPYNYFLSVLFPHNQMQILDYNRVVKDLNGLNPSELMGKIAQHFDIHPAFQPVKPQKTGQFGLYLQGKWYQLDLHPEHIPNDPVGQLDVSLLTDYLLTPILGIQNLRTDKRIDFVGGIRGLQELEKRVDSGEMALACSLYPTTIDALIKVADAHQIMPPKSTWFEPKLADGLVSHLL